MKVPHFLFFLLFFSASLFNICGRPCLGWMCSFKIEQVKKLHETASVVGGRSNLRSSKLPASKRRVGETFHHSGFVRVGRSKNWAIETSWSNAFFTFANPFSKAVFLISIYNLFSFLLFCPVSKVLTFVLRPKSRFQTLQKLSSA